MNEFSGSTCLRIVDDDGDEDDKDNKQEDAFEEYVCFEKVSKANLDIKI